MNNELIVNFVALVMHVSFCGNAAVDDKISITTDNNGQVTAVVETSTSQAITTVDEKGNQQTAQRVQTNAQKKAVSQPRRARLTTESTRYGHVIILDDKGKQTAISATEFPNQMNGNAVWVDLDYHTGKRRVIGSPQAAGLREVRQSKFMIGISAGTVSEVLRSHLQLEDGVGAVVEEVIEESAAAKAGLKPHDILIQVGDAKIGGVNDVSPAVDSSNGDEIDVQLIRGGKKQTLKITPSKRELVDHVVRFGPGNQVLDLDSLRKGMVEFAPGMRLQGNSQITKIIQQAFQQSKNAEAIATREQLRDLAKTLATQYALTTQKAVVQPDAGSIAEFREQMKQLRHEMSQMREMLKKAIRDGSVAATKDE